MTCTPRRWSRVARWSAGTTLLSLSLMLPARAIEMFTYFGDGSRIGLPSLEVPVQAYPGIPLRSDRLRARARAQQLRWGHHREADGAAVETLRCHHTGDTGASRIPPAARPSGRPRAAGSAPEHELVESRTRVAPRDGAGGSAPTDDRSRAKPDPPRIQRTGVSGGQHQRAKPAPDRTRRVALSPAAQRRRTGTRLTPSPNPRPSARPGGPPRPPGWRRSGRWS